MPEFYKFYNQVVNVMMLVRLFELMDRYSDYDLNSCALFRLPFEYGTIQLMDYFKII